ncbi:MAG TPA: tRNA (cytidine(34)-2'-O)-methyltransferase [Steroidobacteraceae bacterium]|jgi:tRNA (cytidine/uridine-2'-O-)-methyltransferase|nr:tRNA (cytidine(34)-2'-O)-methyltransferase [Steroidobacteraceae bacterium]
MAQAEATVFNVLLYEPEIPPNTGNVIRLCANTGTKLHLIGRLGFDLSEPQLRRAGLDYHQMACVSQHADLVACLAAIGNTRLFVIETGAPRHHSDARFEPGDSFLFGPETRGLPAEALAGLHSPQTMLSIPMQPGNRSLNLSNSVAVVVYEAWRQQGYAGATHAAATPASGAIRTPP